MSTSVSIQAKDNTQRSSNEDSLTSEYISQMNSKEKIAYHIAMDHLGTSFNLKKSIGYKEWLKMNQK